MDQITRLEKAIVELNPMQRTFIAHSLQGLSPEERGDLDSYLDYCRDRGVGCRFLAESYDLIVKDTLKEQVFFRKHKRYRFDTYEQVGQLVYHNPEYMTKYMHGLALTVFLWPNHRELHHFFLKHLPTTRAGSYLEVGPGHGYYFTQAMRRTSFSCFTGIDVSETSISMTRDIIASGNFGRFADYTLVRGDFLDWRGDEAFDFLVMAEVLEHVETPPAFLAKLRELANAGAGVFITTCLNAPAIDHIYLYPDVASLEGQFGDAGFRVRDRLLVPYTNLSLEDSLERRLPVNVAYLLEPQ